MQIEFGPELADYIRGLWDEVARRTPPSELQRVKGFLEIMRGEGEHLLQLAPMQVPALPILFFPGLKSGPFLDARQVPWIELLEAAWPAIREEYESLGAEEITDYQSTYDIGGDTEVDTRAKGWKSFYMHKGFRPLRKSHARCPRTAQALGRVPVAKEALFSILGPGAHIPEHSDEFNFLITCHLGVRVPEGCRIRVGPETRYWQEGKCLVLDTSYLHEAWNPSEQRRCVLLIDAWHPDLTAAEIDAIQFLRPKLEAALGAELLEESD